MTILPEAFKNGIGVAVQQNAVTMSEMAVSDLPIIERIEREVYEHPWSMKNFQDSLASGYDTRVLRNRAGDIVGYFIMMLAVDEVHLLNITVTAGFQGRGLGGILFDEVRQTAKFHKATIILLEVRPSNSIALAIYRHMGFKEIGIRKGYYPASSREREDALVMQLTL